MAVLEPGGCNAVVKGTPRSFIPFHEIPFFLTFQLAKGPLIKTKKETRPLEQGLMNLLGLKTLKGTKGG